MPILFLFIQFALAHTTIDTSTEINPLLNNSTPPSAASETTPTSLVLRANSTYWFSLSYSPMDIFVPNKIGLSIGYSLQDGDRVEIEIMKARFSPLISSQLGTFNDQRTSINFRSFSGRNSFNYLYGLSLVHTDLEFGHKLANKIIGTYPYGKAFEIESLGFHVALSNEWIFTAKYKIPIRIDWIGVTQPFWSLKQEAPILDYLNDTATRETIKTTLSLAKWTPRFYFLKIQAGLSL